MDVSEKKLRRKTSAEDVFDRSWSLDEVKTLIKKYQCDIFNFVDLCSGEGRHCVVEHNPNTSQWCHCCHFLR